MQERKKELEQLIDRYLQGQLSTEDKRHLEDWMERLDLQPDKPMDIEEARAKMKERITRRLLSEEPKDQHPSAAIHWRSWYAIAATVLLFLTLGMYMWRNDRPVQDRDVTNTQEAMSSQRKVVKNTSHQDSLVRLEDGSVVRLLANSSLTFNAPFEYDHRAIELEGTAFFKVAPDKNRPFSVTSGNIVTTALGTSFWVEQRSKNTKPKVRLVTGKVSVQERTKEGKLLLLTYLEPGEIWKEEPREQQKIQKPEKQFQIEEPLSDEPIQLMLVFHHKPLREVLPELAAFYNVQIDFSQQEVEGMSFYGTYDHSNQIDKILQTICIANDLKLQKNEKTSTYRVSRIKQ